ncbi:hypothetical protein WOLCODRAFT_85980, partial [Wolfiporia cocos MD-104 SS10]
MAERGPNTAPDKIIVFTAFPSNISVLSEFLEGSGIKFMTLTGIDLLKDHAKMLKAFWDTTHEDAWVLIISGAGMMGLNIAFVNILDTLWSAQEDVQLIGRVWRHPQTKLVEVYRLIVAGTPNVFLNNISFER